MGHALPGREGFSAGFGVPRRAFSAGRGGLGAGCGYLSAGMGHSAVETM